MPKLNHLKVAIIITIVLATFHALIITFASNWSLRQIYIFAHFFFFTLAFLSLNAYIFSRKRKYVHEKSRNHLRVSITLSYIGIYLASLLSFAKTGQIIRAQSLIFLSGAVPLYFSILIIFLIVLTIGFFLLLIKKKAKIKDSKLSDVKKLRIILIISLIFFIIAMLTNFFVLQIENPLIDDKESLIDLEIQQPLLSEISNITQSFNSPNVIFILLESVSAERLGTYGYERSVSPNIDSLANKSIVFERAYTTSTHSDYAQPGLLSSRYLYANKLRNTFSYSNPRLFIWDVFKQANYTTAYFSSQDDRWQSMNSYLNFENLDTYSYSLTDGHTDYGTGLAKKDFDHKTADSALNWLETKNSSQPFFLYLNFQATHNPNAYPPQFTHFTPETKINKYDNSLHYVDLQIGRILKYLEKNNLSNTVVTITSDHGHDLKNRHSLPGHGFSIYNEELLVPAIAHFPGVPPTRVNTSVSHIDFVPSLIDLLGLSIPPEFQGTVMKEGRPIYFVTQSHRYKIGQLLGDIKTIIDLNKKQVEVYNLTSDPYELNNINSKHYNGHVLQLLFWHHCQLSYHSKEKWLSSKTDRCSKYNNFATLTEPQTPPLFEFFR